MMTPESGYTTAAQRDSRQVPAISNSAQMVYAPPPNYSQGSPTPPTFTAGEELKYLDSELGTLFQTIETLEHKLEAVLTPPGSDSDGQSVLTPLASALVIKVKDQTSLLSQANRRLGILLSRIEL